MYLMIRLDYRTGEGDYRTAYRFLDNHDAAQAPQRIGTWILENVQEGATVVKISQGWSPIAPNEVVIERVRQVSQ